MSCSFDSRLRASSRVLLTSVQCRAGTRRSVTVAIKIARSRAASPATPPLFWTSENASAHSAASHSEGSGVAPQFNIVAVLICRRSRYTLPSEILLLVVYRVGDDVHKIYGAHEL